MRDLRELDAYRDKAWEQRISGGMPFPKSECGAFQIPSPEDGQPLRCMVGCGEGWDHISVSRANRTPTWREMDFLFTKFFLPHEAAMQLHVPSEVHVNHHPFCLHIWRPHSQKIPLPPTIMVGPDSAKGRR